MKLLYFTQFYKPESIAAAFRASENSKIWSENGIDVTIFTGYPNFPLGKIFDGYQPKMLTEEWDGDVRVLRSKVIAKPNKTMISRLQSAFSGVFFGLINIFFHGKKIGKHYDVVLGTSGLVFTAWLGWVYAWMHRIPYVLEIRDITYRQLIATGKTESDKSVKAMKWLELFLCKRAKHVVVVTNGFKEILVQDDIRSDKISVITNGVDVKPVHRESFIGSKLILSYFGTLGISQNIMDTFPYAAALSNHCEAFEYLIIGEGAQRDMIAQAIQQAGQSNIKLLHGMSMEELEPYYEKTILSVITLRKSKDFRYTIPSKIFQVMGRRVAILFIGPPGESAEIIRKYQAGIVLDGTVEEDINQLNGFFSKPGWRDQLDRMGRNGIEAVTKHYSRRKLALDYIKVLQNTISK